MQPISPTEPGTSPYRWVVLFTSALMCGTAFGMLISISVFLKPLETEFGWARSDTSLAYSAAAFLTGLGGIFMGRLVDRISPRPIVFFGALMVGLAQLLLSRVDALWQLYLCYGLMVGGLGNGSFIVPLVTNVGSWFTRGRGMAVGIVMAGQSLGGALTPMLARGLMTQMDWREVYLVLGVGTLTILVPASLLIRPPPDLAHAGLQEGAPFTGAAALSPKAISRTLSAAIVFCCICMAIPVVHVYPMALESGIAPIQASMVLAVLMSVSMIGRVGIGRVADYIGGVRALLLASGIQTVMIFWFSQMKSVDGLLVVAVLFAVGYGGVIPSYAIIIREKIPLHRVGRVTGTVFFFANLGMALGGYLGGAVYDLLGGYPAAFAVGALAGVVNLIIVGSLWMLLQRRQVLLEPA